METKKKKAPDCNTCAFYDYDEEYEPSSETTAIQIETAKELIKLVEEYLKRLQDK